MDVWTKKSHLTPTSYIDHIPESDAEFFQLSNRKTSVTHSGICGCFRHYAQII